MVLVVHKIVSYSCASTREDCPRELHRHTGKAHHILFRTRQGREVRAPHAGLSEDSAPVCRSLRTRLALGGLSLQENLRVVDAGGYSNEGPKRNQSVGQAIYDAVYHSGQKMVWESL